MFNFFKMHGIGNDYIYIDHIQKEQQIDYSRLAKKFSNRNYCIGGDGLIVLKKSKTADAQMLIFNCDGSKAKMCGNATRCSAFYLAKKLNKKNIKIQICDQVIRCYILKQNSKTAKVEVKLKTPKITKTIHRQIKDKIYEIKIVDVGNLHAVIFVNNFNFDICQTAKIINNLKDFSDGINVEFVKVVSTDKIKIKVYERGSGLTKACGSGACASAYVYNKLINKNGSVCVVLDGGNLQIETNKNYIKMIGNAEFVYKGEI